MEWLVVFFVVFFLVACLGAPRFGAEDRPGFKHPDRKVRQPVGSWFHPGT